MTKFGTKLLKQGFSWRFSSGSKSREIGQSVYVSSSTAIQATTVLVTSIFCLYGPLLKTSMESVVSFHQQNSSTQALPLNRIFTSHFLDSLLSKFQLVTLRFGSYLKKSYFFNDLCFPPFLTNEINQFS